MNMTKNANTHYYFSCVNSNLSSCISDLSPSDSIVAEMGAEMLIANG